MALVFDAASRLFAEIPQLFLGAPTSANTSGVRRLQCYLQVNGGNLPVIEAEVIQRAARNTSTFTATVAFDENAGFDESSWMTTAPIQASVFVDTGTQSGTLISGKLLEVDGDYDERVAKVTGNDESGALHEKKTSRSFVNQTPSQIVQTLASEAGLSVVANGLSLLAGKLFQIDYVKIANDAGLSQIIHKLAEFEGARWWVKGSTLYYQPADQASGAYPVFYSAPQNGGPAGGNFLKLSVKRNMQLAEGITVKGSGWHKKHEKTVSSTYGSGPLVFDFPNLHNLEQDHVDQKVKASHDDIIRHQFTIEAEMVGDPTIDIGQKLRLSGTSADGEYTIDSIRHEIKDGYTMTIEARGSKDGA